MVLVRFSNTGSTFTISGEAYYRKDLGEGREREDLDEMLGLGHWIMITAVNQLRDEGHVFDFDPKDAAELANEPIFAEMNKVLAAESQRSGAVPIGRTLASNEGALNAFISPRDLAIAQKMLLSGDLIVAENGIYTPRFQNSETASYNSRDKVVEFARKLSGTELLVRVKKGDDLVKVLEGFAKTVIEADKLNLDRHRAAASGV